MTLVNIDPHIIWHRKMHVPLMETFVGRSTWVPAPCEDESDEDSSEDSSEESGEENEDEKIIIAAAISAVLSSSEDDSSTTDEETHGAKSYSSCRQN